MKNDFKMNLNKFFFISTFSFLGILAGCNYKMDKRLNLSDKSDSLSSTQNISFEVVKSFSLSNCLNCHAGHQAPDLTQLSSVQANASKIWSEVDTAAMPPSSSGYQPMTGCKKALLKKWLDLGAPESSNNTVAEVPECANGNPVTEPALTPILLMPLNYETLTKRILQPKCLLCHTSDSKDDEAKQYPFYPYSSLIALTADWGAPAATSKVLEEISNKEDGMPPPETKLGSLSDDEIEFIKKWIDAGKPEN